MNPRRLAIIAGSSCALGCVAAQAQLSVGPNRNITRAQGNQAESAIAINPTNPQNLFMIANNLATSSGMAGAVSMDGGVTWVTRQVATGSDGLAASDGDPTCCFDSFGNLFLCHLTSGSFNSEIGLSTNGGVSFVHLSTPVTSSDQPTITAGAGSVWMCVTASGVRTAGAPVSGLGAVGAFTAFAAANGSAAVNGDFGDIAIGPGGKVAIVYQNANSGNGPDSLYFNLDADGLGASAFGARSTITATNVGGFDFIPAQAQRSIDAEAGLAYDRTGGPHNGRLYLVYTDETVNENNDTNILLRFTDNDGSTWSAAVRLNDDATTRSQFLPKMALDPATGHIAVVWYDCRNSSANTLAQIWGTASTDGGLTWLPNVQISQGASLGAPDSGFDFGDFMGLTIYNDVFYPSWSDDSNSTGDNPNGTSAMDIYTARVTINTAAPCYANCDGSTTNPILNVTDFTCFLQKFAANDPYANCDGSTTVPTLNVTDFTCFLQKFAAGCSAP